MREVTTKQWDSSYSAFQLVSFPGAHPAIVVSFHLWVVVQLTEMCYNSFEKCYNLYCIYYISCLSNQVLLLLYYRWNVLSDEKRLVWPTTGQLCIVIMIRDRILSDVGYCHMASLLSFPAFKGCIPVKWCILLNLFSLFLYFPDSLSHYIQFYWWLFIRNLILLIFFKGTNPLNIVAMLIS